MSMRPHTLESLMQYRSDLRYCRSLLKSGSHSFFAASMLLPTYYRAAATALYAFCRVADDVIDQGTSHQIALDGLRQRLDRIYAGRPDNDPVDRALADIVQRFEIPQPLLLALLEGFEWDVGGRRYETLSELYAYAARVAGTVGVMMSILMGAREPLVLARASDLGVAMQITNIVRDIGEDAANARLYLPAEWMREAGIDPDEWLARPRYTPGLEAVVNRLIDTADNLYSRSAAGIASLPLACRPGIFAARSIYREIGVQISRNGLDPVLKRSIVSHGRKLHFLGRACIESLRLRNFGSQPPLEETRFLVEAVNPA